MPVGRVALVDEPASDLCPWCREPYWVDLLDVWPDERAWLFETCCEEAHDELLDELAVADATPPWLIRLFRAYNIPARSVFTDCDYLRISFKLTLRDTSFREACGFIGEHHRHHGPPCGWRWGHAVYNGAELVGVATVGRPVARALDHHLVAEVNRLCVLDARPRELTVNVASMLYGAAAREARRRGFRDIITYTLAEEPGTSLLAAGWTRDLKTRGGSWSTPTRTRATPAPSCPKVRWRKILAPQSSSVGPLQLTLP